MFALIKSVKGLPAVPAVIIALVVGFGVGIGFKKPRTVEVEVPSPSVIITQRDTVYVDVPVTKYVTKAHTDTVIIEREADTDVFQILSSTTVDLNTEEADYGSIDIEYIHPPWDEFTTTFYPAALPTIVQHEVQVQYRPVPMRYYQRPWFNWAIGVGMGVLATRWYDAD